MLFPPLPPPAPHTPAYPVPGMGPPPPPAWERGYADLLSALMFESDWSSLPESSASDADVWSVASTAPALSEAEAPPALHHLSEEAEALLRYLGEFYSVPADPAATSPRAADFSAPTRPRPRVSRSRQIS